MKNDMTTAFRPGKLLLTIVGRHQGERLVAAGKAVGARGGTILLGRGTATNRILQLLAIGDVSKDVLLTLLDDCQVEAVVKAHLSAAAEDPRRLGGVAALIDVSGILRRVAGGETPDGVRENERRSVMEAKWKLISIIVNNGYADEAMAAARKAGAAGGTILTGRGTGTEDDVKFFGISLVPEKEMLLILAETERAQGIMDAVRNETSLKEPGSGIAYSVDVQEFYNLGK